jgi:predicted RNA-binding protein with PUA-like domain
MPYYLAKTEPDTYSIDDLSRDHYTVWDGVRNAQAVRAILAMQPGDRILIYHSGGVSAIVGLAEVKVGGRPDLKDPKSAVVDLAFLVKFPTPVPLSAVKASHQFDDFALVRQSRLSTMVVPDAFVDWLRPQCPGL